MFFIPTKGNARLAGTSHSSPSRSYRWAKMGVMALVGVLLVGISVRGVPLLKHLAKPAEGKLPPAKETSSRVFFSGKDQITLPSDVANSLQLRTVEAVPAAPRSLPPLAGTLALDTNFLAQVHSRFAGEVKEIGKVVEPATGAAGHPSSLRPLRFGDRVEKGQVLAVIFSKELGEKKSELVDALSQLRVNRDTLDRLKSLSEGVIAQRQLREAERAVESSVVAVAKAERTLRSWQLGKAEIEAVHAEAERLFRDKGANRSEVAGDWPRAEVTAPFGGTILEQNITMGAIVDTATDLFKIADLSHLCVWAHVYEEDLAKLRTLPRPLSWTIKLKADPQAPPIKGAIELIGDIIDPNQHTALVIGHVDNRDGQLRVGQFITASIELPPAADVVEIPTTALVDDGDESIVFIQPDPKEPIFEMRRVVVVDRYQNVVLVRSRAKPGDTATKTIQVGEKVLASDAVELKSALEDLKTTTPKN